MYHFVHFDMYIKLQNHICIQMICLYIQYKIIYVILEVYSIHHHQKHPLFMVVMLKTWVKHWKPRTEPQQVLICYMAYTYAGIFYD
jgi:hypothetical protein